MLKDIESLNVDCTCVTLDRSALCAGLEKVVGNPDFCADLVKTHPNLISAQSVFLSPAHARNMQDLITAIEAVIRSSVYQELIAAHVPAIGYFRPGPVGVFMGYDFHLGSDGPKLIEINTNAGGALINTYIQGAQRVCCAEMAAASPLDMDTEGRLLGFIESFRSEWRLQGRTGPLERIAIVDETPGQQYLYPEFVLFQRLFERHGISASITSPSGLTRRDGALWAQEQRIDLVYNRLIDFDFSQPSQAVLRDSYLAGEVVVTPNPSVYALFADKRNLAVLSDEASHRRMKLQPEAAAVLLKGIPRTIVVSAANAEELWTKRNHLFFKPCTGYGSKAAYRGDKLTRRVWGEILAGAYVAQEIVAPSARRVAIDGHFESLKADLRCYTYDGRVQLLAARLYSGQTTNFRTPGGGFAPVFVGQSGSDCLCD